MGAYLSQPKTDKSSTDEFNDLLVVGASSMQGWRNSQEDAHNSILNFDTNTSFFAVYDGHGGAEVASYCADKLPEFLKTLDTYKNGSLGKALVEAFLGFDKTLLEPHVVTILKILAGEKNYADADDSDGMEYEEDDEDLVELHKESNLPLDAVLEKYKGHPSMPALMKLKDNAAIATGGSKPQSPYLRGRRAAAVAADAANKAAMDPDAKPHGSSTSAAAATEGIAEGAEDGPSSSRPMSSSVCASTPKLDSEEPEEDSTVSSSSSSASKTNSANATGSDGIEAEAASADKNVAQARLITTNGEDLTDIKESEQNGSVTSSEAKTFKTNVSTSSRKDDKPVSAEDATVSGSNDMTEHKQNGSIGSSTTKILAAADAMGKPDLSAISSTSKEIVKSKKVPISADDESTDDDYDVENSIVEDDSAVLDYSSEEDMDDETEEDELDEENDCEPDEEDDEETKLANDQFCANMIEEPGKDSGCTAVVALMQGRDLYVANAGDSRCVVCRNGKAIEMSFDHKPEDDEESARIIRAGGRVTMDGRVNGGLNLSRAIGDHAYKMNSELPAEEQMISALPDIKKLIIQPEDEFMVLACDGIWNFMSSEEVVDFVRLRIKNESKNLSKICEELFDNCLAPNTMGDGTGCDNMTAVIIRFKPSILQLQTKIDPAQTEDVLQAKDVTIDEAVTAAAANQQELKTLKRSASPTENSNEASNANNTKRLKTDDVGDENNTTNSTINATTTSSSGAAIATSSTCATTEEEECDSNNSSTPSNSQVSSDVASAFST